MRLHFCSRHVLLLVALLVGPTATRAQSPAKSSPRDNPAGSSIANRQSSIVIPQPLHPCGLIREDASKIPWMIQDKPAPAAAHVARALGSGDISSQMPPVGNQGSQGSCTAWAIAYYQKTHYEWVEHHWNDSTTNHEFSPAFVYNQINGGVDSGSDFSVAMALIADQGCASMADCPYNQNDCTSWPSESAYARAIPNRGGAAHFFWMQDSTGIDEAKARIDSGLTTVIGIGVWSNFDNIQNYNYTYCVADTYGGDRGGHAVTIVGYDDNKSTHDGMGAFKMVNSWGTGWGQSGYWWMSYVAATNATLTSQQGYYLDDLVGYSPTLLARVRITHSARDKVGIRLGVGSTAYPSWAKDFRTWRHPLVNQPFPNHNIVFDMSDGAPYLQDGEADSVFVRCIDDVSDGKTGTIHYFTANQLMWPANAVSPDTPVSIPDYNVAVYAPAKFIRPHDVGVAAIPVPTGTFDSGATASPQAKVKNYGTNTESFTVKFRIGAYSDTQRVTSLAAGDSATLTFASWTATARGTNTTRCSTALSDDNSGNDVSQGWVIVRVLDAGCTQILSPLDTVDSGATFTPRAVIKNFGSAIETLSTRLTIGTGYADTVSVTVGSGKTDTVAFPNWTAHALGTFAVTCSTMLANDVYPGNNVSRESIVVRPTTGVAEPTGLPKVLSLERPLPDPMRGQATIQFNIPHVAQASVTIRSATGALVRVLTSPQPLVPGTYSVTWNGRDDSGRRVAKGVYFWRLETGSTTLTRKAIKID
ncbi:MAG TPA: FlgD immunoglobulin-like domain containing protein [bacterium]|nr:FlgD immunoglobulin-like domain containing protein [bacterium]